PASVSLQASRVRSNARPTAGGSIFASCALIARVGFTAKPHDGVIRVRAGTLDDTSWLRPARHIWTRSKQPGSLSAKVTRFSKESRPRERVPAWNDAGRYPPKSKRPMSMAKHIGIVVCSAEGAALCYRTICVEGAAVLGPHAHPEVMVHTLAGRLYGLYL